MNRFTAGLDRCFRLLATARFPLAQEGLVYSCPLTLAKRRNLALQMLDPRLLRCRITALPHILHVGVTTACSLRCPACPTGTGALGRPAQHLDFEVFRRTVDELRDSLLLMQFWDWGEPLLHPRLADMIEHATRNGIMTVISTNGNVADGRSSIERLVAASPSAVIVCIDGADQATYEKYRAGGNLKTALDTVLRLRRERDSANSDYPLIEFRSLALRENEHQMPELLKLAGECGADLFSVKSLRPYDYRGANVDETLVPLDETLTRYSYREAGRRDARERTDFIRAGPLRCAKPHYAPTLNSEGILVFCSYALHRLEFFGDVGREGFPRVWRSPFARDIRLRFARQRGSNSCAVCYFRSDHKPTILHQVPLRPLPPAISVACPKTRSEFLAAVAAGREEATPQTV